ncbi:mismatch repair protein MLH2, partial [Ascoidea rubescens DSM 1968]
MAIKRIPSQTAVTITSSSAVFSPVAVIKELIDNSIDASATTITIEYDSNSAGLNYLSVKDNGKGVPKFDRQLMCCNSTTSKISNYNDIHLSINTLGFRGEALFFITQLASNLSITSKTSSDSTAQSWSVDISGLPIQNSFKNTAASNGTSIIVKNLFNKLPVRKKFFQKKTPSLIENLKNLIINYSLI